VIWGWGVTSNADGDVAVLLEAARGLDIQPRARRWTHLPVCVLDAVFSINARYGGVIAVCDRYAEHQRLAPHVLPAAKAYTVIGTGDEQPIDALATLGRDLGPTRFSSEVLNNRSRTSTRGGVLKAEAATRYAEILAAAGVHTLGDVAALLHEVDRLGVVEQELRTVPGNGANDVRLGYLWMVAGDDQHVKPDRMVLRWLSKQLRRAIDVAIARRLLADTADALGCTPWELDHAIWRART
jgi:hypothetical protein